MAFDRPAAGSRGPSSTLAIGFAAGLTLLAVLPGLLARAQTPAPATADATLALETSLARPPEPWFEAATAVRRGDHDTARRLLEPLAGDGSATAAEARLALGLWARAAAQHERCAALLRTATATSGRFEDWRLLALAECHAALDRLPAAVAAFERLLDRHPDSPLRSAALLRATAVRWRVGDPAGTLALIERGRGEKLSAEEAEELERTAWAIAVASDDAPLQRRIARRLLVEYPIAASELQVIELFRQPSGALDWPAILDVDQLFARATSLLAAGVTAGALEALEAVPADRRDRAWSLLRAEILIAAQRGEEALRLLAALQTTGGADGLRREELRAAAAREASRARAGRALPAAAERERLRQTARQALWRMLELAGDEPAHREASIRAHRLLLDELLEEELMEPALALLRTLRRLDPDDSSGARFLWQRGWREYQRRNPTGAIGYWTELATIYPGTDFDRSGRYWSGRAHEALGDRQRAAAIYRQVTAAGAGDFYHRHARARLDGAAAPAAPAPAQPREPWPWDPVLGRARWLSDRGLDGEALTEIHGLGARAERRAAAALAALVEARRGRRRESIHLLSRAFPQLGRLQQASAPQAALRLYYPDAYAPIVQHFAAAHGIAPPLLFAMIRQESAFDPEAVSRAGARGLMQLMPATGRELAQRLRLGYSSSRLSEPEFNIRLGSKYFSQVLEMFDGSEELALAGYNGGPYRIRRLWREQGATAELDRFVEGLKLPETRRYVKRILLFRDSYDRLYPGAA